MYNPLGDSEPSVGTSVDPPRGRHYQSADDVRGLREEIARERPETFGENRRVWQSVKDVIEQKMREAGP